MMRLKKRPEKLGLQIFGFLQKGFAGYVIQNKTGFVERGQVPKKGTRKVTPGLVSQTKKEVVGGTQ